MNLWFQDENTIWSSIVRPLMFITIIISLNQYILHIFIENISNNEKDDDLYKFYFKNNKNKKKEKLIVDEEEFEEIFD